MKQQLRPFVACLSLLALALSGLASPAGAEGRRLSDIKRNRDASNDGFYSRLESYAMVEHFYREDAFDSLHSRVDRVREQAESLFGSASADFETTDGNGIRAGVVYENFMGSSIDWGGSVSYVLGPEATAELRYDTIRDHIDFESRFLQVLMEASRKFEITSKTSLRLGAGVGVGRGRLLYTEKIEDTSSGASVTFSDANDWWSLNWDVRAALARAVGRFTLEAGTRFSQFPKRRNAVSNLDFNWKPISVYLALYF